MTNAQPEKWYHREWVVITALVTVGPLGLPFVWIQPRYSLTKKIIITVICLILTYYMSILTAKSVKNILEYYQLLSQELQQLN